jgi:hypothetical protein
MINWIKYFYIFRFIRSFSSLVDNCFSSEVNNEWKEEENVYIVLMSLLFEHIFAFATSFFTIVCWLVESYSCENNDVFNCFSKTKNEIKLNWSIAAKNHSYSFWDDDIINFIISMWFFFDNICFRLNYLMKTLLQLKFPLQPKKILSKSLSESFYLKNVWTFIIYLWHKYENLKETTLKKGNKKFDLRLIYLEYFNLLDVLFSYSVYLLKCKNVYIKMQM